VPSPPRQVNLCTRLSIHIISPCTYTRARARTHTHTHTTLPSRTSSHRTECHPPAPGESMYTTIYPHHLSMHIYACARTHTLLAAALVQAGGVPTGRSAISPASGESTFPSTRLSIYPYHLSMHVYARARTHTHYLPPLTSSRVPTGVPSPPRQVNRSVHLHDYLSIYLISG